MEPAGAHAFQGGAGGVPLGGNPIDIDRLFYEGDDQTWQMEDWSWDPCALLAEPRTGPSARGVSSQAAKRHKAEHQEAAGAPAAVAAAAAPAAAAFAGGPPAAMHLGPFQSLLAGGDAAGWEQLSSQARPITLPAAAWQDAAGACSGHAPQARPCQALSHGLPFLAPGSMEGLMQHRQLALAQQQQLQHLQLSGCCGPVGMPALAAGAACSAGALALAAAHIAPAGAAAQGQEAEQRQPGGSQPLAPPAPAAGMDCCSVAETGGSPAAIARVQVPAPAGGGPPAEASPTATSGGTPAEQLAAGAAAAAAAAPADSEPVASMAVVPGDDGGGEGEQRAVCQVPGCGRDLSGLKEYHQRYRICDVHIKLPQVMKDGRLQRFCQQCGRFHDLSAFDGNRKSCREQLQKHNARRRRRAQLEHNMTLADSLVSAVDDKSDVGKLLSGLLSNPFQLQALRVLLGVQTHPALPAPAAAPAEHAAALAADGAAGPGASTAAAAAAAAPGCYATARDVMAGAAPFAPSFESQHRALRLSAKLFNVTPAQLPPDVRDVLTGWLASAPASVEGYIRPGCVLLSLHMTVDRREYEEAAATGMQRLLASVLSPAAHEFWRTHVMMLQLCGALAVVYHGQLVSLSGMAGAALDAHALPHGLAVSPLAVVGGRDAELRVSGRHICGADATLVVKGGGQHLHMGGCAQAAPAGRGCCGAGPQGAGDEPGPSAPGRQEASCVLAAPAARCQVVWVEVARGAYVSEPRPLLVVDDEQLAQEVASLSELEGGCLSSDQVDALLLDLGAVLRHMHDASAAAPPARGPSHAAVADKARRLLVFACDQGWTAVARAVLPLAQACCVCAHDIVAAIHDATAKDDALSLLHRAVRSGCPALVRGLLDWGAERGYAWHITSGGPRGVTPLHLAALLEDDGAIALLLLDAVGADRPAAFTDTLSDDGVSPFHLAFQQGHYGLDRVLAALGLAGRACGSVLEQQLQPTGWQLLKEVAATAGGGAAAASEPAEAGEAPAGAATASGARALVGRLPPGPLKERLTTRLDACLYCESTLPPLLLTIKAKCAGCGERQPCVAGAAEERSAPARKPPAAPRQPSGGRRRAPAAAALAPDALAPACAHADGRVLSVTALCQTCHANRVLEVA